MSGVIKSKVTKLVLPVAGLGKRLRPLTLTTPKNLIEVGGKPLIEYVLEEAAASGIREVILVVSPAHRQPFEAYLAKRQSHFRHLLFHIREQAVLGGDGHAVLETLDLIAGEPVAVRFCDDVLVSDPPVLASLVELFGELRASLFLLERVPEEVVSRYGVVRARAAERENLILSRAGGNLYSIEDIVEKPEKERAPSRLAIVGGYIFMPRVMENFRRVAETLSKVAEDALRLATALEIAIIAGEKVYGWEFRGKRLDCGTSEKLRFAEEFFSHRMADRP